VTSDEFGQDLEHVEVLQKKFDEFQKDLANHEDRVNDINQQADKLIEDQHPEEEAVRKRRMVRLFISFLFCFFSLPYHVTKITLNMQDCNSSNQKHKVLLKEV